MPPLDDDRLWPVQRQAVENLERSLAADRITNDEVVGAGFSAEARERDRELAASFEKFLVDNRDEITALKVLYTRPYRQRLRFANIKALAQAIEAPPRGWTTDELERAYERLERSRVRAPAPACLPTSFPSCVKRSSRKMSRCRFPSRCGSASRAGWPCRKSLAAASPKSSTGGYLASLSGN